MSVSASLPRGLVLGEAATADDCVDAHYLPLGVPGGGAVHAQHLLTAGLSGPGQLSRWALFVAPDGRALAGRATLGGGALCGHPGIAHGGLLAALLDDACGALFIAGGRNGYTAALAVTYRKPVLLAAAAAAGEGTRLRVDARLEADEPSASKPGVRKVSLAADVRSADGAVLHASATALFITSPELPLPLPLLLPAALPPLLPAAARVDDGTAFKKGDDAPAPSAQA